MQISTKTEKFHYTAMIRSEHQCVSADISYTIFETINCEKISLTRVDTMETED